MSETIVHLFSPLPSIFDTKHQLPTATLRLPKTKDLLLSSIAPLALAIALNTPSPSLALPHPTTPYSQSQTLDIGLDNGKIRPCPSVNPGCVSSNPKSSSFAFPWIIQQNSHENAAQKLRDAILKTQRNVKIQVDQDTSDGHYLQAEVDGGFGRDVMEFLVKRDVVTYRSMAMKVTYVYPFTTAFGDSKGQNERLNKIKEELGWYSPNFESMD
ncbi:hypothetical protein J5N97_007163 [Dioscorea zingiberensis]|uniref:Thylakoid lumenal 17.9 kDa protein, chloroplastic n=1 Tax=Dioscorea zingiberensis TaxID=325984 RepID=A0A9D5DF52_9LILI|nr:hypothetical protein J5N97_007163 [Dioscorea zingiberensis]